MRSMNSLPPDPHAASDRDPDNAGPAPADSGHPESARVVDFGTLPSSGRSAQLYTVSAPDGSIVAKVTNYGARLVSLYVSDRQGVRRDVVLGADNLATYVSDTDCLGAIPGRNANRIAGARFSLNGTEYRLNANEGTNNLHSGPDGYEHRLWECVDLTDSSVTLSLSSPDGDQGMPANLRLSVTYSLFNSGRCDLAFSALSDGDTILNPTTHTYFNLEGADSDTTIEGNILQLNSSVMCTVGSSDFIPSGKRAVTDTPCDFREPKELGAVLQSYDPQLSYGKGLNHCFLVEGASQVSASELADMKPVARLCAPGSGICLRMWSDLPSVLVYTADYLEDFPGKSGHRYGARSGVCLEPGFVPNSINNASEDLQPVLTANTPYERRVQYRFSAS